MKHCIKEPIPEVHAAIVCLERAVDAHLSGDTDLASARFREANCPVAWEWLNEAWTVVAKNVVTMHPEGDTVWIPKADRDPDRNIASSIKQAVLERDGYRCRYCGLPVVHADIRKIAHHLYPEEVPWNSRVPAQQHSAFQVTWLQFDHVEPHSHGGRSSVDNVVVTCALCNFGKDRFTLRQLNVADPRLRPPEPSSFDGLERLRSTALAVRRTSEPNVAAKAQSKTGFVEEFFFAYAYIRSGYVNIPPINGKARWFKLDETVSGREFIHNDVPGCVVQCHRKLLLRRGIDPEVYIITE